MGLSESDLSAVQTSSIEVCLKELDESANILEQQSESFKTRLQGVSRERNPSIEKKEVEARPPVQGQSPCAIQLVTVIQKLRVIAGQNEMILRHLDL